MHPPVESGSVTAPGLHDVLQSLREREPIFHRPEFGRTHADFERMTIADFFEIGASGQRHSRAHVLDLPEHRVPDPAEHTRKTSGFHCHELGSDTYLLTCTLEQGERVSRRSTIWRRDGGDWVIIFHQGTLVA